MSKHHITGSNSLFYGNAYNAGAQATNGRRGVPLLPLQKFTLTNPVALDADGIAAAQAVAAAGNLTLNGALASGGSFTEAGGFARAVQIVSTNAGDTTQTATVTGTDYWGQTVVETLTFNGTTAVVSDKTFKTVTQIAISAALTGNASAGTTNKFGLPYKLSSSDDVLFVNAAGADEKSSSTIVTADATSPATATTNDVRGAITPNTAANGTNDYSFWFHVDDVANAFGVAQYAG